MSRAHLRISSLIFLILAASILADQGRSDLVLPELPDREIFQAYERAAVQNVLAALNRLMGDETRAKRYEEMAGRIRRNFVNVFWVKDHFAEYFHPQRGFGQTLRWRGQTLRYRMNTDGITGSYEGGNPQRLGVRLLPISEEAKIRSITTTSFFM